MYVLLVFGINFKLYRDLFKKLGIKIIVWMDNDIYKNDIYGLKCCLKIVNKNFIEIIFEELKGRKDEGEIILNKKKKDLYKYF